MKIGDTIEIIHRKQGSCGKGLYIGQFNDFNTEANVVRLTKITKKASGYNLPAFPGFYRFDNFYDYKTNFYLNTTRIVLFEKHIKENKILKRFLKM